jgi:hypothetical protein
MPTVIVYLSEDHVQSGCAPFEQSMAKLRQFVATELSCPEKSLEAHEISIRLVEVRGKGMIAPIEIEIKAHAYPERVRRADEICLALKKFVIECINQSKNLPRKILPLDVQVWIVLAEFGHSWT